MSDFFKFASENPWLTFFLFCIVGETIVRCVSLICTEKDINEDGEDD